MAKPKFPYKNETNQRYSKQLFLEEWRNLAIDERLVDPVFTLHLKKDGLICLGQEYVADADPTGYKTSTRLLGDFAYWKHLLKAKWFREAVEIWDEELDAKLFSEGLSKIREIATSEDKGALVAAKFLVQHGYKIPDNKRGRPSKEEIKGTLKRAAEDAKDLEDDARRIGLVATRGA